MNDVFRAAHKKELTRNMAVINNPELDLTPRPERGWNLFQCCFPGASAENEDGKSGTFVLLLLHGYDANEMI